MGYRISEENTPRPYAIGVPFYDLNQANRVTDARRRIAEEQVAGIREAGDQTARNLVALVNAPISAYREQQDREFKKAEFEDQRQARAAAKALAEEQLAGAKQLRELEGEFGARQREAAIGQQEAARNLANLQAKAAEEEQAYYTGEASAAGLPGAQPGQTVRQYELAQKTQQGQGALELQKSQLELTRAQTEAQRDIAKLNAANAGIDIKLKQANLNETERAARVRSLVSRLSAAGDDANATQAIANELGNLARPDEYSEALSQVRSNRLQQNIMLNEVARRDPNYSFAVGRMQEATDAGQQLATIKASLDDALQRYTEATTPWSDEATDAMKNIQTQLKAAGYEEQAKDLDSVISSSFFELGKTRKERAKTAIRNLQRSLGAEYQAKYGHLGPQYKNFGTQLVNSSLSAGQKKQNAFKGIGQPQTTQADLTVPMPTQLGPNFYQQIGPNAGAPQVQQTQQMPPELQQQNRIPWMGQSNGTIAPQGQSPQMQSPAPMQQNQAPMMQLPPSFGLKKRVTDNGGR